MVDTKRVLNKLASRSRVYERDIWLPSITELTGKKYATWSQVESLLLINPQLSLEVVFRCYAFARGGGADRAGYHRISVAALRQLVTYYTFEEFTKEDSAPDRLWEEFQAECQQKQIGINEKMNRELIRGLVQLAQEAPDYNLAIYFKDQIANEIQDVFKRLNKIKGIGPKIASFIIRDFAWLFNLEEKVPDQHKRYLQPVDIWLGRIALCLWPDLPEIYWPIVDKLAGECSEAGVSGIEFNQGAWYFGAQEVRDLNILCDELSKL